MKSLCHPKESVEHVIPFISINSEQDICFQARWGKRNGKHCWEQQWKRSKSLSEALKCPASDNCSSNPAVSTAMESCCGNWAKEHEKGICGIRLQDSITRLKWSATITGLIFSISWIYFFFKAAKKKGVFTPTLMCARHWTWKRA